MNLSGAKTTRILGVDPGTRRCGYGVVDAAGPGRLTYVECGVIELPARAPLERRLAELLSNIQEVISELSPAAIAVEDVFHGIDARAALVLGHARGVVLAAAGAADIAVSAYPPATVKKSVSGQGRAGKEQVAYVVSALLGLRRIPRADAADALAVAICHAHHQVAARMRAALAREARGPSAGSGRAFPAREAGGPSAGSGSAVAAHRIVAAASKKEEP